MYLKYLCFSPWVSTRDYEQICTLNKRTDVVLIKTSYTIKNSPSYVSNLKSEILVRIYPFLDGDKKRKYLSFVFTVLINLIWIYYVR